MIIHLDNNDWVKEGRDYYSNNHQKCPFCQQPIPETFTRQLEEYFDERFELDLFTLQKFKVSYLSELENIQTWFDTIRPSQIPLLDQALLKNFESSFEQRAEINKGRIASKIKSSSRSLALESFTELAQEIEEFIRTTNVKFEEHNSIVNNINEEKARVTKEVWRFICGTEKKDAIELYKKEKSILDKTVAGLAESLSTAEKEYSRVQQALVDMERGQTSTKPTIEAINKTLRQFSFHGFKIVEAEEEGYYRIVRPNGICAKNTLSEGERNFLTFLYFYHLAEGHFSQVNIEEKRIVVIDDPVSSLDSEALYLVSILLRNLISKIDPRDKTDGESDCLIEQLFILTHNTQFHKEVTFNKGKQKRNCEHFWRIRKRNECSSITHHVKNPIKTSYQLLWEEVAAISAGDNDNIISVQNAMRRILESYFTLLGGEKFDSLVNATAVENFIFKSLLSWLHTGSHFDVVFDDSQVSSHDLNADKYLEVFRKIFESKNHLAHYEMMMGQA